MNIRPLGDRVLIEPLSDTKEGKTKSGLYLPETASKERPEKGKVIAVGPGKLDDNGKLRLVGVKKGDVVLFTKYGPNEIKVDGREYLIAKEEDIIGVINE
ncbi:MAG: co-chaperone GroES [Candidatus Sungbacteria bacterium]|uniref:Co-chaperonin GroES n=1 Tax=Candidatus Sungiibacteriota bacterium TaxID=2750080 RepID=A0A931WNL5_9BACT|nr:co-chaperone GroES [Candidatus Sungbacteria bacterium]